MSRMQMTQKFMAQLSVNCLGIIFRNKTQLNNNPGIITSTEENTQEQKQKTEKSKWQPEKRRKVNCRYDYAGK